MKCCGKEMIEEEDKLVCKGCGYELIPLFKKENLKMTKLGKILKALEKEGYKIKSEKDIAQTVDFLGVTNILEDRGDFAVQYTKDGIFTLETTWANRKVTKEWFSKLTRIYYIVNKQD